MFAFSPGVDDRIIAFVLYCRKKKEKKEKSRTRVSRVDECPDGKRYPNSRDKSVGEAEQPKREKEHPVSDSGG